MSNGVKQLPLTHFYAVANASDMLTLVTAALLT